MRIICCLLACLLFSPLLYAGEKYAESNHWPIALDLPEGVTPPRRTPKKGVSSILAWTPKDAKQINAIIMSPANTDSKHFLEYHALRKVAAKYKMAVVYMRYSAHGSIPTKSTKDTQLILDALAEKTGLKGFAHAPWITFGKSSMGRFPFYHAWAQPQRTIATISYHAETPKWPLAEWVKPQNHNILHVSLNGETEWGGTWFKHVRPSLLNYHANTGWLSHITLAHGVGHGNYVDGHGSSGWGKDFPGQFSVIQSWDYLSLFVEAALEARLPKDADASQGPVTLKAVDQSKGYFIDKRIYERMFMHEDWPLVRKGDAYVVNPVPDDKVTGYVELAPMKAEDIDAEIPVNMLASEKKINQWLLANDLNFAMKHDPIKDADEFTSIYGGLNKAITIDDKTTKFRVIPEKYQTDKVSIKLGRDVQRSQNRSMFAYAYLKVEQAGHYQLAAPFTQTGRVQMILNGKPIAHKQLVKLEAGTYPMLLVVRLQVHWGHINVSLTQADDEMVKMAKTVEKDKQARLAKLSEVKSEKPKQAAMIFAYDQVSEEQRKDMFFLVNEKLMKAWFELHAVKGHKLEEMLAK